MLTIFHTADWHLGQSLLGFDRDFEHTRFLDWLSGELRSRQPDALIVCGDVFDTINPSATAQKRYFNFLAEARGALPALQIVMIAGNHDAGSRLEAPSELLDSLNISVVGTVRRTKDGEPDLQRFLVPLRDRNNVVRGILIAVPFLRPSDVPVVPDTDDPYISGIRELYRRATEAALEMKRHRYAEAALIAAGHCHLQGGVESRDSERRLVIGGAEAVGVDMFESRLTYVALGHLHKAQQFSDGRIRYSGSPIPLSFSESGYRHRVLQLAFEGDCLASGEELAVPRSVPLLTVPTAGAAPIDQVIEQLKTLSLDSDLPANQHPFLEVRVLEDGPDPQRRKCIEEALVNRPVRLASIKLERKSGHGERQSTELSPDAATLGSIDPEDVFLDAWRNEFGSEPETAVMRAFHEIVLEEAAG